MVGDILKHSAKLWPDDMLMAVCVVAAGSNTEFAWADRDIEFANRVWILINE